MARIEDLVEEIPDPRLRGELLLEVKNLKQTKKFGLVFEEHLRQPVRIPSLPLKSGKLVTPKVAYPISCPDWTNGDETQELRHGK
jgi:adenine-specific DNA-methyltransferase